MKLFIHNRLKELGFKTRKQNGLLVYRNMVQIVGKCSEVIFHCVLLGTSLTLYQETVRHLYATMQELFEKDCIY